ncbi:hypothetical protein ACH44C_10990 [Streptomyces purpureus]|uniref:hypothetical protein n=1 Tax=Streptomyces purpureus TaxID=1951 RepID=UPI0037AC2A40
MTSHPQNRPCSATTAARGRPAALLTNPYGLTLPEVRAEVNRCLARGWMLWEIRHRFTQEAA